MGKLLLELAVAAVEAFAGLHEPHALLRLLRDSLVDGVEGALGAQVDSLVQAAALALRAGQALLQRAAARHERLQPLLEQVVLGARVLRLVQQRPAGHGRGS